LASGWGLGCAEQVHCDPIAHKNEAEQPVVARCTLPRILRDSSGVVDIERLVIMLLNLMLGRLKEAQMPQ
jgi:hypothetical protein